MSWRGFVNILLICQPLNINEGLTVNYEHSPLYELSLLSLMICQLPHDSLSVSYTHLTLPTNREV